MKKIILILLVCCVILPIFAEDVSVSFSEEIPYPAEWKNLTSDEVNLNLLNILTKISQQEGLQYISRMAGYKSKTLFEDSYCISDLEDKKSKIEDPVFNALVDTYQLFAYQKDNRFGGNTYIVNYVVTDDSVELKITNHSPMRFAGVSCVKSGCLTMTLKVTQGEDNLIIDCSAFVPDQKAKISFLFYTVDLESSFERRATALRNWFVEQLSVF